MDVTEVHTGALHSARIADHDRVPADGTHAVAGHLLVARAAAVAAGNHRSTGRPLQSSAIKYHVAAQKFALRAILFEVAMYATA